MSSYQESVSYRRLSEEGKKRLDMLATLAARTFEAEIQDCFVSEIIEQDGRTIYPSFVLLLSRGLSECHNPMTDVHYDLYTLQEQVRGIDVESKNYEIGCPTPESRLSVQVHFGSSLGWHLQLQAAAEACDELTRVLKEWFVPNLASASGPSSVG